MDCESVIRRNKQKAEFLYDLSHVPLPFDPVDTKPVESHTEEPARARPTGPITSRHWKNKAILRSHNGWVECVDVDPSNAFFVTGSTDRTIKVWDMETELLRLTLSGHTGSVLDLSLSHRSPYLFSVSDAKEVMCWDLNRNEIIRSFFGHLSGVYCVAAHHDLDLIATGGRDATARVWDVRSRREAFCLEGHDMSVLDVLLEGNFAITSSADATIRKWDLRVGKCVSVVTRHQKAVRALCYNPRDNTFVSASADSMKLWSEDYVRDYNKRDGIINSMSISINNDLAVCYDDGFIELYSYNSPSPYQQIKTVRCAGSIECESGIFDCCFDITGSKLVTAEADKAVKIWN